MVQEASPSKPRRGKKRAGVAERLRLGKLSEDNELQRKPIFCPRVDSWLRRWKSSGSQALLPIWLDLYVHSPLPKGKHPSLSTIAFHAPVFLSTWQHLRGFLLQCCCTWRLLGITEKAIQPVQRPWVQNLVGFSSCVSLSK